MQEHHTNATDPSTQQLQDAVHQFINGNHRLKDLQGLTEDNMEAMYATAYTLYKSGRYTDAQKVFQALCIFDHMERKYWMGLGAAHQILKNYKAAIDAYSLATILDVFDPLAPLQAAECHLALGHIEEAKSGLNCAIQYAGQNNEAKARAEALLSFLNHNSTK